MQNSRFLLVPMAMRCCGRRKSLSLSACFIELNTMSNCYRFAALLCFSATSWLVAEEQPQAGKLETLSAILGRIHEHAATKAWREEGWKDEQIETWLEQVIGKIAVAAKLPELKLPVRFADVKPSEGTTPPSRKNALLVGKTFNLRPITV